MDENLKDLQKNIPDIFKELSPHAIMERLSVKRFQTYLDTGYFPRGEYSITWDMLAWLEDNKNKTK